MPKVTGTLQGPPVPTNSGLSPYRDLSNEPELNLDDIQSDILLGHSKDVEAYVLFTITNPGLFKSFVANKYKATACSEVFRPAGQEIALATGKPAPKVRFGIGFTAEGLEKIGSPISDKEELKVFKQNLAARAVDELNDPDPSLWLFGNESNLDGIFIITAESNDLLLKVFSDRPLNTRQGWDLLAQFQGAVRPGTSRGREHFNFLDGVSQPGVRGSVGPNGSLPFTENSDPSKPNQGNPGQDLIWPGEFVFSYFAHDPKAEFFYKRGEVKKPPEDWMKNGSYMVFRRLRQFVPEMHNGIDREKQPGQSTDQLKAQIVGRWPDGTPVVIRPDGEDPDVSGDEGKINDFEFGNDRAGLTCPWAAHIRKTYPRDDVPGNPDPIESGDENISDDVKKAEAHTQTRRMLRRGIQYGPELSIDEIDKSNQDRGLLFKCYVTSLDGQFEFVQKSWANNPNFVQAGAGLDAIIGQSPGGAARSFAGVGHIGLKPLFDFEPWVQMTGGAYFFSPSISFLRGLAAEA